MVYNCKVSNNLTSCCLNVLVQENIESSLQYMACIVVCDENGFLHDELDYFVLCDT